MIDLFALELSHSDELAFRLGALTGVIVLFVTFLLLASGSVQSVRVDHDGLAINRYIGPSRFLPWAMVRRIEPMSFGQVFRQVWFWPGLPPRGSIVCMSTLGYYRIDCEGECWYFNPRNAQTFLETVERYQRATAPP